MRQDTYAIDTSTGHLVGRHLCWVCFAMPVHVAATMPRVRACRFCLMHDRWWAGGIGLRMLLPLMDWPSQPVIGGWPRDRSPWLRAVLVDVWSQVSVLDRWRRDSVAMAATLMQAPGSRPLDLVTWQENLTVGPRRSRACWSAFTDGYYPGLTAHLRDVDVRGARR